jgi:hypothetical protein
MGEGRHGDLAMQRAQMLERPSTSVLFHRETHKTKIPARFPGRKSDLSDLRTKKPISGKPEIGAHVPNFNLPSALICISVSRAEPRFQVNKQKGVKS